MQSRTPSSVETLIREALPVRFQGCTVQDMGRVNSMSSTRVNFASEVRPSIVWGRIQKILREAGIHTEQDSGREPTSEEDRELDVGAKLVEGSAHICRMCVRTETAKLLMTFAIIDPPIITE